MSDFITILKNWSLIWQIYDDGEALLGDDKFKAFLADVESLLGKLHGTAQPGGNPSPGLPTPAAPALPAGVTTADVIAQQQAILDEFGPNRTEGPQQDDGA